MTATLQCRYESWRYLELRRDTVAHDGGCECHQMYPYPEQHMAPEQTYMTEMQGSS